MGRSSAGSLCIARSILQIEMVRANLGNMELATRELLRALRGRRSQRALAKRLGYRANPITDWEHGRRYPTAEKALHAAALVGVDVPRAFADFHAAPPPHRTASGFALAPWLEAIRGTTSLVDLAARTGASRHALGRWLRGEARPRLPEFFQLVDAATGRLPELVARLVPIEQVPSLEPRYRAMQAARRVAYDAPWTEAVLRVLESVPYRELYKHQSGWIAERLGISHDEEKKCLALLRRAGVVSQRRGRYEIADASAVDTRGDRDRVTALLRHWANVGLERVAARRSEELYAYNVVAVSAADLEQIRQRLSQAFREVRSLVSASEPAERVALVNLQLVLLERM
jgi:transcriptional regulator with XRE-family HTH domain